ncbi:DsrE family protein [uncultured Thiodictyon sp.]|uniref:DsrE family protein n=1 Tax=uncultured Thiodictyon sp. TaxID=1846217 RepID=UPI0025CD6BB0|nr:DsrE family protein [uncultured Thiodictyon sp.]
MDTERNADAPVDHDRRHALRQGAVAAAGLLAGSAAVAQVPESAPPRALKIVLHVSAPDGWPPALSNAKHLAAQYPSIQVRIVTDGGGVYGLQGSSNLTSLMEEVARLGVRVEACRNALEEKKIAPDSLPAFVKVVPAGVVALAQAQADGFAYIKP